MALYFRPGGPVIAGIGIGGFMGGIIFTVTNKTAGKEEGTGSSRSNIVVLDGNIHIKCRYIF